MKRKINFKTLKKREKILKLCIIFLIKKKKMANE